MQLFYITHEAREDLMDIWDYIGAHNETAADKLLQTLNEKFISLATPPYIGQERPELGEGIRTFTVKRYIIIFRIVGKLEILRVLHGSRDLENMDFAQGFSLH